MLVKSTPGLQYVKKVRFSVNGKRMNGTDGKSYNFKYAINYVVAPSLSLSLSLSLLIYVVYLRKKWKDIIFNVRPALPYLGYGKSLDRQSNSVITNYTGPSVSVRYNRVTSL